MRVMRTLNRAMMAAVVGLVGFASAADAVVRVDQNHRLRSDSSPFRGKDQVAFAVNPANPQHVVAVHEEILEQRCEGTASFDGGTTWSAAVALPLPAPVGSELPFAKTCQTYQTLAFGSGQNVYATSASPRTAGPGADQRTSTLVYRSTDGGLTWQPGVVAMPGGLGGPSGGPNYARPTVAVDPGAGPGGQDRLYVTARETTGFQNSGPPCPPRTAPTATTCPSVRSTVSSDGGQTFSPVVQVSPPGVPVPRDQSQVVINDDGGSLSVAWRTTGMKQNEAGTYDEVAEGTIQVARSTDQGQTWNTVTVTDASAPSAFAGVSFSRLAGDGGDNLYIVYTMGPPGPITPAGGYQGADDFNNPRAGVWFQRSKDDGATWSTPKQINDPTVYPGNQYVQTRHPNIAVAPNGRVDIVWNDKRHWFQGLPGRNCGRVHGACDDPRLSDTYYAYSTNEGTSFTTRRVSDESQNNDIGYDYRNGVYWSFGPQVVALGNDTALIGWMDSREGSFETDTLDIYLAKVHFKASSTVPQTRIDRPDVVSRSVALSQLTYRGGGEAVVISNFATRSATKVVIVNQDDVAGAMAAAVLARANLATVLLAPASGLPANVRAEVARLDPAGAFIVGDTAKLSEQIRADLVGAGIADSQITRLAAADAAGTAALIAAQFDRRIDVEKTAGVPAFDAAVIANPAGPDAAAAVGLAATRRLPILYVGANSIPAATSAALTSLNIDKTLVIGGSGQIGEAVKAALPGAKRLGGSDQYDTSRAVADESIARGVPANIVYVADGSKPIDAALLGAVVGRKNGIMLLAPAPLPMLGPSQAAEAGLEGVDRFVLVDTSAPAQPAPGAAEASGQPVAAAAKSSRLPAKLRILRARVSKGRLLVQARMTAAATGNLKFTYRTAGRTLRFSQRIRRGTVNVARTLAGSQARQRTGVLDVGYAGNARVRGDSVRTRVASRSAALVTRVARIAGGKLQVSGTLTRAVRGGAVRIRLAYQLDDGDVRFLYFSAPIRNGAWRLSATLPAAAGKGGQLSIRYTGSLRPLIAGAQSERQVGAP